MQPSNFSLFEKFFSHINCFLNVIYTFFQLFPNSMLPKAQNNPALLNKSCCNFSISLHVSLNFGYPVVLIRLNSSFSIFPVISMPKIGITKHGNSIFCDYYIRFSY